MPRKTSKPKPTLIREQKEAARALGTSDRNLRLWLREPTFPDCAAGYDLAAIKQWRDENKRAGSEARQDAHDLQTALKREKLVEAEIKNQQSRLKLAEREGELLPRETLERALSMIATKACDGLDQLPDLIRGECSKKDRDRVAARLKKELDKWRTDLSTELESLRSR